MKAVVSWSGGKDAYMALVRLWASDDVELAGLLTTFVTDPDRVGVHEVPAPLVRRQAEALGLTLFETFLPTGAGNAQYEAAFGEAVAKARVAGACAVAFGDLFLEDIRDYRDGLTSRLGVAPLYPVWRRETGAFASDVIASGVKAVVCSVDLSRMPLEFAGRDYDETLLAELPEGVDPCGENGEFHTFVYDGPGFNRPIPILRGEPEPRGWLGSCPLSLG